MSSSTRFIILAIGGWIGLRALSLGMIPGGEALAFDRPPAAGAGAGTASALPPVATTEFAPLDPVAPAPPQYAAAYPPAYPAPYPMPYGVPVAYRPAVAHSPAAVRYATAPSLPQRWGPDEVADFDLAPAAARYAGNAIPLDEWPVAAIAGGRGGASAPSRPRRSTPAEMIRAMPGFDRLSMSGWAMMRREPGPTALAANGQLGGSQAGAQILWRFRRDAALSIRSSAPIGGTQRAAELAAGVRWQPLRQVPVALTAERRQSFGPDKGASAFALFAEGGVYDRPIAARFNLDAYLQAGVVGIRDRALFVDGSATLTRPLWHNLSAGIGLWGGAQPGLARFDAGPRLSYRIGGKMRVHADYRQRLVGRAAPGSGPVLTLAANF